MWVVLIILSIILIIIGLLCGIISLCLKKKHSDIAQDFVAAFVTCLVIGCIFGAFSGIKGVVNYCRLPSIEYQTHLTSQNIKHYHAAMDYDKSDEKSEHHNGPKFTGDLGEPKDNRVWQLNYQKYYHSEKSHYYYKTEMHYYQHPIKYIRYFVYLSVH